MVQCQTLYNLIQQPSEQAILVPSYTIVKAEQWETER